MNTEINYMFFVQPETIFATSGNLTRSEYSEWLVEEIAEDKELSAAIFAIAEFYKTVENCMLEKRCSRHSVQNTFAPYAKIFYDGFYLALRRADCEYGFPNTERTTARIAKLPETQENLCIYSTIAILTGEKPSPERG